MAGAPKVIQPVFRQAVQTDIEFITSSWIQSYRWAPAVEGMRKRVYFRDQHRLMESLIPRSIIVVMVDPDESPEKNILGWIAYERLSGARLCVHYCYVKQSKRRLGIARMLVDFVREHEQGGEVWYTHRTEVCARIAALRDDTWLYSPHLAHHREIDDLRERLSAVEFALEKIRHAVPDPASLRDPAAPRPAHPQPEPPQVDPGPRAEPPHRGKRSAVYHAGGGHGDDRPDGDGRSLPVEPAVERRPARRGASPPAAPAPEGGR